MKVKIVALHGSPGSPADWEALKSHLPEVEFLTPSIYDSQWIEDLRDSEPQSVLALAHSFGASLLLAHADQYVDRLKSVILCAPFLAPGQKISPALQVLLRTPGLGDFLVKKSHQKKKKGFFQDLIFPHSLDAQEEAQNQELWQSLANVQARLDDSRIWKKMISLKMEKILPARGPSSMSLQGLAILGGKDKISDLDFHRRFLENFPGIHSLEWPEAGHGLIWSHSAALAKLIKPILNFDPILPNLRGTHE
jgi:pimeloyl-ACP methyl ester carboxylesterase